jgi:hypothetical protein
VTTVGDTLGLLQEALQLAQDLGYRVREEPLGDLPGGACVVGNARHVLLNLEHTVSDRLDLLLRALAADPRLTAEPMSRLLEARLATVTASG